MTEALNDEGGNVDSNTSKNMLLSMTKEVVSMKVVKVDKKRGNAWWTEDDEKVLKENKDA